jgi:GNAT superfamily N-acetyltransferase
MSGCVARVPEPQLDAAFSVARATANDVVSLRARVLRPGQPVDVARYDIDGDSGTVHVAAFDPEGRVISCATVFPEPFDDEPAWRLRGMATDPAWQGRGVGSAVLARAIDEVERAGGQVLWCNARLAALNLYLRAGFHAVGDEFEVAGIGPHYVAVLRLSHGSS